ncbi:hypothetical protein ABE236_10680 [Priestia endophytica]|uniref:hypothetical protein n=1 Tax=Priestia endophytica TaxID=135735 RepID=UPI003D2A8ADB
MNKTNFIIFITAFLLGTSYTIFKIITGEKIGFNEFLFFSMLLMLYLPTITTKIERSEEEKRKIAEKSSKISYFLLLLFLFLAVLVEDILTGEINTLLAGVLALGMATLPLVEFFMMKKYHS